MKATRMHHSLIFWTMNIKQMLNLTCKHLPLFCSMGALVIWDLSSAQCMHLSAPLSSLIHNFHLKDCVNQCIMTVNLSWKHLATLGHQHWLVKHSLLKKLNQHKHQPNKQVKFYWYHYFRAAVCALFHNGILKSKFTCFAALEWSSW